MLKQIFSFNRNQAKTNFINLLASCYTATRCNRVYTLPISDYHGLLDILRRPNWSRMHNGAVGSPAVDLLKIATLCLDSKKI